MLWNAPLPFAASLGLVCILLPLPWHWRARNTPTLLCIFWCLLTAIPAFIGSVVWYNNEAITSSGRVWCDIVTKLNIGGIVGVATANLCITRQLESIAAARQIHYSAEDKRRRFIIDLLIGLGLPCLVMSWHIVVQGHRFDIIEGAGCRPTIYWSLPAIFLIYIWPIAIYAVSSVYAVLAIRLFITRRYQFAKILESSKSAISTGRFVRLIALAALQLTFNFPIVLYTLCVNLRFPLFPWISWDNVHYQFWVVLTFSLNDLHNGEVVLWKLTYWTPTLNCIIFFLFFGVGEESLAEYRRWWMGLRGFIVRLRTPNELHGPSNPAMKIALPQYLSTELSTAKADESSRSSVPELRYQGVVVTVHEDNMSCV